MPLLIIKEDITTLHVDAIVNAANRTLRGGGGVDGAIHRAAGAMLDEECRTLGGCEVGEAKLTKGYSLPSPHIIHTVGPFWNGGKRGEEEQLASCYWNSLKLAKAHGFESIAFPLISAGAYRYPPVKARQVAEQAIIDYLSRNDMMVYLCILDDRSFSDLKKTVFMEEREIPVPYGICSRLMESSVMDDIKKELEKKDESFSDSLLGIIRKKQMDEVECYKRANIDRKLFSKIKSDVSYRPSKSTVLAFAIALKLTIEETEALLKKAGFALSDSKTADIIIRYFIEKEEWDIYAINDMLFAFDQSLLGGHDVA